MSMRYLFHILMSIRDGNPSTAKDYRMPEEQFRADVESNARQEASGIDAQRA
ncbi:hypothetical protein [Paenibacillus naphthalenovorans]|uniref:Uncharacterized protein n=1 Tax=Paenibacillus naphthalenovorans TaxID=162209 RepID=A0A0U2UGA9_9BACL|nr:hypothetical protein [Paenibacillus naphthalenovorans]ALS25257.1 hypothetical protein IJ22_49950 [Paenibacillus naphthalenovorans]